MKNYTIRKLVDGSFTLELRTDTDILILTNGGYYSERACRGAIQAVAKFGAKESNFVRVTSRNGKFTYHLQADNGQVIGEGPYFASEAARDFFMVSVMEYSQNTDYEYEEDPLPTA